MAFETILFEENDHIGLLTLNRPKTVNALNQKMIEELDELFDDLALNDDVRVVILTGNGGKGFCSGMDMKESMDKLFSATPDQIYKFQSYASRLYSKMRSIPQPIIAAIHGAASGAGFSFAMASDVRLITPQARFNAAYINIGLGGADLASSYFLPRLIGSGRANEYLLTGDFMNAENAMELGFASHVVEKEILLEKAFEIARKMADKNPLGLRMTKEAINQNLGVSSLEQALHIENRNQSFLITALKLNTSQS